MIKITAKTLEEALEEGMNKFGVSQDELIYEVEEEKKGLFNKKVVVNFYEVADVIEYAEKYLINIIKNGLQFEVALKTIYRNGLIKILIESDKNSILIGKNGQTLQALNELTKLAVSFKFKKKFRILLDIGDYKDNKYNKVISIAKRAAREVLKTHLEIKLDPMTPDERKKVHTALSSWSNIKTESHGDGKDRSIVIKYVGQEEEKVEIKEEEKGE